MAQVCGESVVPTNMEPDKCEGWFWAPWDTLPEGRFASLSNLNSSPFVLPSPDELEKQTFPSSSFPAGAGYVTGQEGAN